MAGCHHPLCFTYNRALRHFKMCIACVCRGSALGRNSLKSANRGTCFEDPDVLNTPADAAFGMVYTCVSARSSPSVSRWKSGVVPSVVKRNCLPNMLSIANSCRARSPLFYDGKTRRALLFLKEIARPSPNSLPKPNGAATFSIEHRRARCPDLIAPGPAPLPCQPPCV